MNKEETVDNVKKYIQKDNTKYAIMINGPWGAGKTYLFYNSISSEVQKLNNTKKDKNKLLYFSLYGIESIDELSRQLVVGFVGSSKKKFNNNQNVSELACGVLAAIGMGLTLNTRIVSFSFSSVVKLIKKSIRTNNMIICFDDFERCNVSINVLLGFINNLVEHCNCKVIILADEDKIGKMNINSNLELKYQSLLTSNRKFVEIKPEKGNEDNIEYLTLDELEKLNNQLYSENYFYKEIKEKVIGKTILYSPDIKDILQEILDNNDDNDNNKKNKKGLILEEKYRKFLCSNICIISKQFGRYNCHNVRILLSWIELFYKVYNKTYNEYDSEGDDFSILINNYIVHSIRTIILEKTGNEIKKEKSLKSGLIDYEDLSMPGNKYDFIDKYIITGYFDEKDFYTSSKAIIKEREKIVKKGSAGKALNGLVSWRYMEDDKIKEQIENLIKELKDNQYVYEDYSVILGTLVVLHNEGLYDEVRDIPRIMLNLIENDNTIQEEREIPIPFSEKKDKDLFDELYLDISRKRKEINKKLKVNTTIEDSVYKDTKSFLEYCKKNISFFLEHKSFMEYIEYDQFLEMINTSSVEGLYDIKKAINSVYYIGNVSEFFKYDIRQLKKLLNDVTEMKENSEGVTRRIALNEIEMYIEGTLYSLEK